MAYVTSYYAWRKARGQYVNQHLQRLLQDLTTSGPWPAGVTFAVFFGQESGLAGTVHVKRANTSVAAVLQVDDAPAFYEKPDMPRRFYAEVTSTAALPRARRQCQTLGETRAHVLSLL
jgi:hypothetical protein